MPNAGSAGRLIHALDASVHSSPSTSVSARLMRSRARAGTDSIRARARLVAAFYCTLARRVFGLRVPLLYQQHGFHHHNYGRATIAMRRLAERFARQADEHRIDVERRRTAGRGWLRGANASCCCATACPSRRRRPKSPRVRCDLRRRGEGRGHGGADSAAEGYRRVPARSGAPAHAGARGALRIGWQRRDRVRNARTVAFARARRRARMDGHPAGAGLLSALRRRADDVALGGVAGDARRIHGGASIDRADRVSRCRGNGGAG